MLHDAESELCQKLLTRGDFPGTPLLDNISKTINARTWRNIFFETTFEGQSTDIYC